MGRMEGCKKRAGRHTRCSPVRRPVVGSLRQDSTHGMDQWLGNPPALARPAPPAAWSSGRGARPPPPARDRSMSGIRSVHGPPVVGRRSDRRQWTDRPRGWAAPVWLDIAWSDPPSSRARVVTPAPECAPRHAHLGLPWEAKPGIAGPRDEGARYGGDATSATARDGRERRGGC